MEYKTVEMCSETQWELKHESQSVHSIHGSKKKMEDTWKFCKEHFPQIPLYPYKVVLTRLAMVEQ
jgi:hypothetical protein